MNPKILLLLLLSCSWLNIRSTATDLPPLRSGQDYALFFAVSTYDDDQLPNLPQTIENARAIAGELERRYGFITEIVENPTLAEIQSKLADYKARYIDGRLPQDGQLFIFFSGHGIKQYNNGSFLPKDADSEQVITTGLTYNVWRPYIDDINCQHILIAVDACYSVTFDPNWPSMGDDDHERFQRKGELSEVDRTLANHERYRSRLFFTSDAKEDIVPGRSNFARKLLDGLANYRGTDPFLTAETLFANYIKRANPAPNAGDFGRDDPRSSFLFFAKAATNIGDARADRTAYQRVLNENTIPDCQQYLRDYPQGDFRAVVEQKLQILEAEEREIAAWQQAKATNTWQAYTTFMEAYPNSIYYAVAEANRKNTTITPTSSPEKEGRGGSNSTTSDGYIRVEGGTFTMGCKSNFINKQDGDCSKVEKPAHEVTISTFYLSPYEVTQAEWRDVMGSDPPELYNTGCDQCPVEQVSWNDVQEFIQRLNAKTGQNYRLPTEAEWEYAARGGNQSRGYLYSGSNEINEVAWYSSNYKEGNTFGSQKTTRPVGTKQPNELGLYDMSGNVWEWCADWDGSDYYKNSPRNNPQGPDSGSYRVQRGGSWRSVPASVRCAYRNYGSPDYRYDGVGFRLARAGR